jgi:hypothetical protein
VNEFLIHEEEVPSTDQVLTNSSGEYKSPPIYHKVKSPNLFRSLQDKVYKMIQGQIFSTVEEGQQIYEEVRTVILSVWDSLAAQIDQIYWGSTRSVMVGFGLLLFTLVRGILKLALVLVWSPKVHNLTTSS